MVLGGVENKLEAFSREAVQLSPGEMIVKWAVWDHEFGQVTIV